MWTWIRAGTTGMWGETGRNGRMCSPRERKTAERPPPNDPRRLRARPSSDQSADVRLHRLDRGQPGEHAAFGAVVLDQACVLRGDPGVVRVAGLPGPAEDHAAQSDLHQLLEAVETGLESCVKDRAVNSDAESGGRSHGVLLGMDTQADVVQLARQASIGLLSAKRTAAAAALTDGAVGIAGRRAVVSAAQNSVVAHDHRADV